jgi:hypothetical protein
MVLSSRASPPEESEATSRPLDFVVLFHIPTAVVAGEDGPLRFNLPDGRVVVLLDHMEIRDGVSVENGMTGQVTCRAHDIIAAQLIASESLNWVIQIVSFASASAFHPPEFIHALDVTPGRRDRRLEQRIPYATGAGPRRMFRKAEFTELWSSIDATPPGLRDNIGRALGWYRKAAIEINLLDRFVNIWSGLEAINQPIKDKHNLPREKPLRVCPNPKCRTPVAMTATDAGIEFAVTNLAAVSHAVFKDALRARGGLMHGHMPLAELLAIVSRVLPDLQSALVRGIMHLVGIDPSKASGALREPLATVNEGELVIHALLRDTLSPAEQPQFGVPQFELLNTISPTTEREGARVQEQFVAKLKATGLPPGVKFDCKLEAHGPSDPSHPTLPPEMTIVTEPVPDA